MSRRGPPVVLHTFASVSGGVLARHVGQLDLHVVGRAPELVDGQRNDLRDAGGLRVHPQRAGPEAAHVEQALHQMGQQVEASSARRPPLNYCVCFECCE